MREVDDDLRLAIAHNLPFAVKDVADVLAQVPGEADESSWYWIVRLADDRLGLITGACDYTGWDCQSGATIEYAESAAAAAEKAVDSPSRRDVVRQLLAQLAGDQPYATYLPAEAVPLADRSEP